MIMVDIYYQEEYVGTIEVETEEEIQREVELYLEMLGIPESNGVRLQMWEMPDEEILKVEVDLDDEDDDLLF